MFNKLFICLFVLTVLTMCILTFLCYSQLQSIGFAPPQIVQNFESYDSAHKTALWISSAILLILANVILWSSRKAWALWLTFATFSIFILLNMWWLGDSLVFYKKQNNLWEGGFAVGGLIAAIFVVVIGIGLFFNQFIVIRMRDKMFDKPQLQTETLSEDRSREVVEEQEPDSTQSEPSKESEPG